MAYLPLSTANLPDPVIDPAQGASPADHFDAVTYTGNGTSRTIPLDFATDFVWAKRRDGAEQHGLIDVVRGGDKYLDSGATTAEGTSSTITFGSSGMNLVGANWNGNLNTYVAWNWKANGSGVSNTDGDIPTTVSVSTTSGFSIVSYTCPATTTTGDTIGHGLGVAPEFAIFKNRDTTTNWGVYHKDIGNTGGVLLNDTGATITSVEWWNNTSPTSTEMSLGRFSYVQNNSQDYIAYCFHSVEGFSKFGSYVGNGSADGPFVYTGFRPAFVIAKANANEPWWIMDNTRDSYNVMSKELVADGSDSEYDRSNAYLDFLSNGFKLRNSDFWHNNSGVTYIYMAFAENPFKYSNAR